MASIQRAARPPTTVTLEAALTSLLGVSSRRFSQYERGEVEISPSELETVAPYLGVSLDHFSF